MSQRLIAKHHPKTHQPIVPMTFRSKSGLLKEIWPVIGASPEDESNDEGASGTDDGDKSGTGSGSEGQDNGDTASKDGTDVKAELEALKKRMQAADRRASEAEKKVQEYEDAKKTDEEKTSERLQTLEKENGTLQETVRSLRLQNAFLSTNSVTWHDSDAALALAEREGFLADVTDDDGNIKKDALAKALKALADKKPFLVKASEESGTPSGPSGDTVGAGGRKKGEGLDEAALRKKYPALNR